MREHETLNWRNYPMKGYGIGFLSNGMTYTCIRRFKKHKYNASYGRSMLGGSYYYYLLGPDNFIVELIRSDLLKAMQSKKIIVTNLKLYSDDRICFFDEYKKTVEQHESNLSEFKKLFEVAKEDEKLALRKSKAVNKSNIAGNTYYEEVRKGMILRVSKTSWSIKYPVKIQNPEDSFDGVFVMGSDINEHISDIKNCYRAICEGIKKNPNKSAICVFCGAKYESAYYSEVGEFLFYPNNGKLVVIGEQGMKQWVKDIEYCVNRVSQIRDELGWKSHKGFLGKLFSAY